jgi:hypothetical protein
MPKKVKLFDSKGDWKNYVDFRKMIFPMIDKIHNPHGWIFSLDQYVFKFILHFSKFWVKLHKFIMMKMGNPLVNKDGVL